LSFISLPPHPKFGARARIPTISAPADRSAERSRRSLSAGLVVTARTVAEVLAGWVGVPAEGLLESG